MQIGCQEALGLDKSFCVSLRYWCNWKVEGLSTWPHARTLSSPFFLSLAANPMSLDIISSKPRCWSCSVMGERRLFNLLSNWSCFLLPLTIEDFCKAKTAAWCHLFVYFLSQPNWEENMWTFLAARLEGIINHHIPNIYLLNCISSFQENSFMAACNVLKQYQS